MDGFHFYSLIHDDPTGQDTIKTTGEEGQGSDSYHSDSFVEFIVKRKSEMVEKEGGRVKIALEINLRLVQRHP
jgi:hypothetical protein